MQVLWEGTGTGRDYIFGHLFFINLLLAIVIVFFQRKQVQSVWTWLLLLYSIPILGFVFYLFLGTDMHKQKMFRIKEIEDHLNDAIRKQEYRLQSKGFYENAPEIAEYEDLIRYNLDISEAVLTDDNDITIYTDGNDKFEALIEDIRQAKKYIHIQYYIIKNDVLFNRIKEVLIEKAAEGVEVRILYDGMGCRSVKRSYWQQLNSKGIKTSEFFPATLRRLHLRINYRNHRKIVVIDGEKGYVGGFNIGKEYIGLDEKFGYWRDTHLRIEGAAVASLELRFILDWNYASRENLFAPDRYWCGKVADRLRKEGQHCRVQIVSSGPDSRYQNVRDNYLRMIGKAKQSIYIQTPYFIPDDAILSALLIAVHSGIQVNVMIPCKPDHPFVYWATYSYIGDLVMEGANCYTYNNGFLHAKGMIVDDKVMCYGTANMDIRSFALNFEVNAIVYDEGKAIEMRKHFEEDLKYSRQITKNIYVGRSLVIKGKEQMCRLLSPLL
ncbi:MAG: cardiolipin synthase [Lachnospiraceae bacterium]|nr:cardiolipin synthase [Lachnospiraceae bacterium]